MNTEGLGVIIPVYKGGLFLDRLVQELRELKEHLATKKLGIELVEVLFVDDCSVDNSWEILQELEKKTNG